MKITPEKLKKINVIAGLYGNALEWYDFLLYASFASLFSRLFFPASEPFISTIATFTVFAIGFLMRPIGGILLGNYADIAGRRKALIISVTIMSIATLCIACLPSYQTLGFTAPLLFTTFRLVQGIAVGGELTGSATYLIEQMFNGRRGLAGSLVLSSAFFGIFMGSLTAALLSYALTSNQLLDWGWRLAYLAGGILGLLGIYLRLLAEESPLFLQANPSLTIPVKLVFTSYLKPLIFAVTMTSIIALTNYILIAYATNYLVQANGFTLNQALIINLYAVLLLAILIPLMGWLSDHYGHRKVFLIGLISLTMLIFPIFWLLTSNNWINALISELLLAITLAPLNATISALIVEIFPTHVRASGSAIGYNIAQAVFGGTVPLVTFTLIELTGSNLAPAWYVFIWAVIVLIAWRPLRAVSLKAMH